MVPVSKKEEVGDRGMEIKFILLNFCGFFFFFKKKKKKKPFRYKEKKKLIQ